MRGEHYTVAQLAEEAAHIEIAVLGHPIGKQDQYITAFGGLNHISFRPDGYTSIEPQPLSADWIRDLFDSILLLWTGITRDSKSILQEQNVATERNLDVLRDIKRHCEELRAQMRERFDPVSFGGVLHETWFAKRRLASVISSSEIDRWYDRAREAGAIGGKIAGAGGGGFLLLVVPPGRRAAVCRALSDLVPVSVQYETSGARPLLPAQ